MNYYPFIYSGPHADAVLDRLLASIHARGLRETVEQRASNGFDVFIACSPGTDSDKASEVLDAWPAIVRAGIKAKSASKGAIKK
jgi:hypothetical protein